MKNASRVKLGKLLPAGTCCLGGVLKSGRSSLNDTDFSNETDFSEKGKRYHHNRQVFY